MLGEIVLQEKKVSFWDKEVVVLVSELDHNLSKNRLQPSLKEKKRKKENLNT